MSPEMTAVKYCSSPTRSSRPRTTAAGDDDATATGIFHAHSCSSSRCAPFFCRCGAIGVKILQIGLLVLQDSVRIRAEFLPEPFDPRLVVESEADDRHPLHIGNARSSRPHNENSPRHALAVHEHAVHIKDHRIHMHTSRIRLHAPKYSAPGRKKQAPPCADRGKRQPPRPDDRSGCEFYWLTTSRYRNVTTCARVQVFSGQNSVALIPFVMPCSTAHRTALP